MRDRTDPDSIRIADEIDKAQWWLAKIAQMWREDQHDDPEQRALWVMDFREAVLTLEGSVQRIKDQTTGGL
jgi:hypothetical protein